LSGNEARVDLMDLIRHVNIAFFLVRDFSDDLRQREEYIREIFELFSKKILQPVPGTYYPLEEFKEAIKESEKPGRGGKIFLSSY
jgi:NADPH:quinone reductase-like Zn-dependent oxidoreductase